jgi:hypothetical protein
LNVSFAEAGNAGILPAKRLQKRSNFSLLSIFKGRETARHCFEQRLQARDKRSRLVLALQSICKLLTSYPRLTGSGMLNGDFTVKMILIRF